MGRIQNYDQEDPIDGEDKVLTTNSEGGITKNSSINSILDFFQANYAGVILSYTFADPAVPTQTNDETNAGFFTTNDTDTALITTINLNDVNTYGEDVSSFILALKNLLITENLRIKLRNTKDSNEYVELDIVSIIDNTTHFTVTGTLTPQFSNGTLTDSDSYLIDIQSSAIVTGISNVVEDTSPQMGGLLEENGFGIKVRENAKGVAIGDVVAPRDGGSGAIVYSPANANGVYYSGKLGIALQATTPTATIDILTRGIYNSVAAFTGGSNYFLDNTLGQITTSTSGFASSEYIQFIGFAVDNDNLYFDPSASWVSKDGAKVNGITVLGAVASVNTKIGVVVVDPDDLNDTATTNKFTTAGDISKLSGIEASATADQTDAEIRTAVDAATDSNVYTDSEKTIVGNTSGTNSGDQTITLTGDVTGSGTGSFATTIAAGAIGLPELNTNTRVLMDFYNGSTLEADSFVVTSNGTVITGTLEKQGGGDMILVTSGGFIIHDTTPAETITLTVGTDTVPVLNYIYILTSTDTLTVNTSGFTLAEHTPIATVVCQSAASLQTDGAYKVHLWTDHVETTTNNGHLSHVNTWIRQQHATYHSGVAPTFSGDGTGTIGLATAAGEIHQLHNHTFPAFTNPATIYCVNDPDTTYREITNIADLQKDSTGASLTNKTYAIVFWGVVSQDTGDCKIFCNLPSGSEGLNKEDKVREDKDKEINYSIPNDFKGTGFLIHRLVIENNANTTWSLDVAGTGDDLRGQFPNTQAGSSTTIGSVFPDSTFRVQDDGDDTKQIAFQASGITTATTRTITMPDSDVDLGDIATNTSDILLKAPLAATVVSVTENYTTANKISKTSVTMTTGGAGDTLTLDDTGLSAGFEGQFFNDTAGDVTLSSAETIKGDNTPIVPGAFAYYLLIAANTWEISIGAASLNLVDDLTPELGGELDAGAHSIGGTVQTATGDGTTTIDWKLGNMFAFQFGAFNETFTFTAPTKPGTFILKLVQDSVGSRTATWPASVEWPGGTAPTLTTTLTTGTDIITFFYDGTDYFAVDALDFS